MDAGMEFEDEMDLLQLEQILCQQIETTCEDASRILAEGAPVSPYICIRAESSQSDGPAALDWKTWMVEADVCFGLRDLSKAQPEPPIPSCLRFDARRWPLRSNTLAQVFSCATLHCFPDPCQVVAEIHRVLAPGGSFFASQEPDKQQLYLPFDGLIPGKQGKNGHNPDAVLSAAYISPVLKDPGSDCLHNRFQKSGQSSALPGSMLEILACPTCLEQGRDGYLELVGTGLGCTGCGTQYPLVDGVFWLWPAVQLAAQDPER